MVLKRGLHVRISQAGGAGQDLDAPEDMLLHDLHFMGLEATGFVQDIEGDLYLANIMQQRADSG